MEKESIVEEIETEQVSKSEEKQKLISNYIERFIKEDLMNIVYYCKQWEGTNGRRFKSLLPEDIVFKVLELLNEGRRKCYTKSYKHFKGSVYFHVRNELFTFFNCRRRDELNENSPESLFTLIDAENYFEDGYYADGAECILDKIEAQELKENIIGLFDPNEEIDEILVLEEIFRGSKRKEIAEALKIKETEVTNIKKKIKRRISKNFDKNLLEVKI